MENAGRWLPYCGEGPSPAIWLERWNFDLVLLLVIGGVLAAGWVLRPDRKRAHLALAAIMLALFVSPFCALGSSLFSARAIHHVVLALVLAPVLARSLAMERWRIPASLPVLTALEAGIFWFWHAPPLYSAALSNDLVFWVMQATLVLSAAAWWVALGRAEAPAAVAMTLATMVQMGALGALLTFAGRAFYAPHYLTTQAWGWTPLEDQQIAGLIMWAPASAAYLMIALAILYRSMQPGFAR